MGKLTAPYFQSPAFTDPVVHYHALRSKRLLSAVCLAVLCIILTLGLWPFHSPQNQVTWLRGSNGLSFGRSGTVLSPTAFQMPSAGDETCCTIEIWAQPRPYQNSATLLAFYAPENPYQLRLRQSLTDLRIQAEIPNGPHSAATKNFYVPEVFRRARPVFITITSGEQGTKVYIAGRFAGMDSKLRIPKSAFTGQILLGDSPLQPDSWSGQVRGLAIYDAELNASQVFQHYDTWTKNGRPEVSVQERNVALYLFDEHTGRIVHNQVKSGIDLYIPERYMVVNKIFMEPFWKEFNMSRSYWSAVLKNIVGFIPLGFCFYAYVSVLQIKRATLFTVFLGCVVSVTIEILQAYLPTRDSGMTDIITNTLGTWGGVLLYQRVSRFARLLQKSLSVNAG